MFDSGVLAEQEEGYITSALQGFQEVVEMQANDKGEWYCRVSSMQINSLNSASLGRPTRCEDDLLIFFSLASGDSEH